jgi:hypothetical protein
MWSYSEELKEMASAVLEDYDPVTDVFRILEEHENLISISTKESYYDFTLEELMLEYVLLLKLKEVKK